MNNTVVLDSHAEATEHRPISPIEHDRVAAAAAAHDALAIGEPLLIVAGGPAAMQADLGRALKVDRLAVGEDVLALTTAPDGAFPAARLTAYLGLPAHASDVALAAAITQYAEAETRLVVLVAHAERLDEDGVAIIRRLRHADPPARALSVVLLGDHMVGLVADRLLRPAPPGGLRFIRLTPLALTPAAPVAGLSAAPSVLPPVAPPPVVAPPEPPPTEVAAPAAWGGAGLAEALEEPAPAADETAAAWDQAPEPTQYAAAVDHDLGADDAVDLLEEEPLVEPDYEPAAERAVPYWESLPERPPLPDHEAAEAPPAHLPAAHEWQSYQDTPDPAPEMADPADAPADLDHGASEAAPEPPPAAAYTGHATAPDIDWRRPAGTGKIGTYPETADHAGDPAAAEYNPAEAAAYQDAFAQLAAQEMAAAPLPRAVAQPKLRRAEVLGGGRVEQDADDLDEQPAETVSHRPRMILPIAGVAVLAALVAFFVVRAVVSRHAEPPGMQTAQSVPAPAVAPPVLPPDPLAVAGKTDAVLPVPSTTTAAAPTLPGASQAAGSSAPPVAAPGAAPLDRAPPAHAELSPPAKPDMMPIPPKDAAADHALAGAAAPPAAGHAMAEAGASSGRPTITAVPLPPPASAAPPSPAPAGPTAAEQQAMALPAPSPLPPVVSAAPPLPPPALPAGPGLLVIAKADDTLNSLYARVYKGLHAPPFEVVAAMNPHEIKLGDVVVFPAPPGGWRRLPNTAGR